MELVMGVFCRLRQHLVLCAASYDCAAKPCRGRVAVFMELVMGVGPMNLVITNDALYQLSYTSAAKRIIAKTHQECKPFFSKTLIFLKKGRAGPDRLSRRLNIP